MKIAKVSILGWMGWVGVVLGGCDGWIFIYHLLCLIFLCPHRKFQPHSSMRWILDAFCNFPWKTQNTPLQAYFSKKLWAEFFYFHFFCKTHGPPRLFSHFLETGCLQNLYPPNFYQGDGKDTITPMQTVIIISHQTAYFSFRLGLRNNIR